MTMMIQWAQASGGGGGGGSAGARVASRGAGMTSEQHIERVRNAAYMEGSRFSQNPLRLSRVTKVARGRGVSSDDLWNASQKGKSAGRTDRMISSERTRSGAWAFR